MKKIKLKARLIPQGVIEHPKKQSLKDILNIECDLIADSEGILLVANDIVHEQLNELLDKINNLQHLKLKELNVKIKYVH